MPKLAGACTFKPLMASGLTLWPLLRFSRGSRRENFSRIWLALTLLALPVVLMAVGFRLHIPLPVLGGFGS
jgi:hypothetical protein